MVKLTQRPKRFLFGGLTGSLETSISVKSRSINWKNHVENITLAGEDILKKYLTTIKRGITYKYSVAANRGGKRISKEFSIAFPRRTNKYTYSGGIILNPSARRWFNFLENIVWRPHVIPIEYMQQHIQHPGKVGKYVNRATKFVLVSQNKKLLGLVSRVFSEKSRVFNRTVVRAQKVANDKSIVGK